MRATVLFLPLALVAAQPPAAPPAGEGGLVSRSVKSGGRTRSYLVHVPKGLDTKRPAPLVIAYHGAAMTGRLMKALTGLNAYADEYGFVVAYPDGTGIVQTWNSGGIPSVAASAADDVAFTRDLIDDVKTLATIDPKRTYAAGYSNGGMMAFKLANESADTFAAICCVGGSMTFDTPSPKKPVSVLMFHGTEDLFVPYGGSDGGGVRGPALKSVEYTAKAWAKADGCPADPVEADMPDIDPKDGCRVKCRTYAPGTDGAAVALYTIERGGHTWPGRPSPGGVVGKSTKDIDANILMWEFFRRHARK